MSKSNLNNLNGYASSNTNLNSQLTSGYISTNTTPIDWNHTITTTSSDLKITGDDISTYPYVTKADVDSYFSVSNEVIMLESLKRNFGMLTSANLRNIFEGLESLRNTFLKENYLTKSKFPSKRRINYELRTINGEGLALKYYFNLNQIKNFFDAIPAYLVISTQNNISFKEALEEILPELKKDEYFNLLTSLMFKKETSEENLETALSFFSSKNEKIALINAYLYTHKIDNEFLKKYHRYIYLPSLLSVPRRGLSEDLLLPIFKRTIMVNIQPFEEKRYFVENLGPTNRLLQNIFKTAYKIGKYESGAGNKVISGVFYAAIFYEMEFIIPKEYLNKIIYSLLVDVCGNRTYFKIARPQEMNSLLDTSEYIDLSCLSQGSYYGVSNGILSSTACSSSVSFAPNTLLTHKNPYGISNCVNFDIDISDLTRNKRENHTVVLDREPLSYFVDETNVETILFHYKDCLNTLGGPIIQNPKDFFMDIKDVLAKLPNEFFIEYQDIFKEQSVLKAFTNLTRNLMLDEKIFIDKILDLESEERAPLKLYFSLKEEN